MPQHQIKSFRDKFPQYGDLSDKEIIGAIRTRFKSEYSDLNDAQLGSLLGFKTNQLPQILKDIPLPGFETARAISTSVSLDKKKSGQPTPRKLDTSKFEIPESAIRASGIIKPLQKLLIGLRNLPDKAGKALTPEDAKLDAESLIKLIKPLIPAGGLGFKKLNTEDLESTPLGRNILRDLAGAAIFPATLAGEVIKNPVKAGVDILEFIPKQVALIAGTINPGTRDVAQKELGKSPLSPLFALALTRGLFKLNTSPKNLKEITNKVKETGELVSVPLTEKSRASMEVADANPMAIKNIQPNNLIPFPEELVEFHGGASPPAKLATAVSVRLKHILGFPSGKKPEAIIREQIYEWNAARQIGKYESERFIRKMEKDIGDPNQLNLLTRSFEPNNTKGLSPKAKKYFPIIRQYLDEGHRFITDSGLYNKLSYIDNYIPHIWEQPTHQVLNAKGNLVRYMYNAADAAEFAKQISGSVQDLSGGVRTWGDKLVFKNPFTQKRKIPSIVEGESLGLKLKSESVADILRVYDHFRINTVANVKFADFVNNLKDIEGKSVMLRKDKAPADYIELDNWALRRAVGRINKEGKIIISKENVKVHPDYADAIKVIFSRPFSGKGIKGFEAFNALAKHASLSLSFFHHAALTEASIASGTGPIKTTFRALKSGVNPFSYKEGLRLIRDNPAFTKTALESGLQIGAVTDVQRGRVQQMLKSAEKSVKNIPILGKTGLFVKGREITVASSVRGFVDVWNKALWDYYFTGLKLDTFFKIVERESRNPKNEGMPIKQLRIESAQIVNDTFGGQVWELLMINPKTVQVAHWALLAPDWTISTLRQFEAGLWGLTPKGWNTLRGRQGRHFWMRAGLYYFLTANAANYALTKYHTGEGRFMFNNTPGNKLKVFQGFNEEGRELYLRPGKQFHDPFNLILRPAQTLGAKLSPGVQVIAEQLTRHTSTGFPTEFASNKNLTAREEAAARASAILGKFKPFTLRGSNTLATFPQSKGLTSFRAVELFVEALQSGDANLLAEARRASIANSLDPDIMMRMAKANITRKRNSSTSAGTLR